MTHSDLMTSSWKQGGLSRALWIPPGFIPTGPRPQKGPQSCENAMPLTLTSFNLETQSTTEGMWAWARLWAAGQPRGATQWRAWTGKGDVLVSITPPVPSCPGWEPSTRHIHLLLEG